MEKKKIEILGIEINRSMYPNLYRIAERNPEGLAMQLQEWAQKSGNTDLVSVAATLEHDLEHEKKAH